MGRYLILAFCNAVAASVAMGLFWDEALQPRLATSLLFSLGFPLVPLTWLLGEDPHSTGSLVIANSFLWAAMVDWFLRRFVDRPKDSGVE